MGNLILPESKINQAISIPFQAAGFTAQEKATARQNLGITNAAYVFKGQVATVSALPQGAQIGDMYYVTATSTNYAWDGTAWINIGNSMTGYVPYNAPIALTESEKSQAQQNIGLTYTELTDLKMLGYTVPKEMPIQNYTLNGVYHQRVGRVDLGSLSWTYESGLFTGVFIGFKLGSSATCERYENVTYYPTLVGTDKTLWMHDRQNLVMVHDSAYTDATAFRNSVQGLYLYYELATELTRTVDGNEIAEQLTPKLLWENASPSSAFAGGSIAINELTTNYRFFILEMYSSMANSTISTFICPCTYLAIVNTFIVSNRNYGRQATVYTNGLTFTHAYFQNAVGSFETSGHDDLAIPYRIYGVK